MKESCKNIDLKRKKDRDIQCIRKKKKKIFNRREIFIISKKEYYVERDSWMERLHYYFYRISDVSFSLSILYYHTMIIKEIGYDETW